MNEGYKTVELIDDARITGWSDSDPNLNFIFNKKEPTVVGINATDKYRDRVVKEG